MSPAKLGTAWRCVARYAGISALALLPCYWQPRIQAGDLSSHIYNSWLARLIESGRMDGLVLVRQTTNVLFDLILKGLLDLVGAEAAQRIAVSLTVLIFFWGAFRFMCAVSRGRPWKLLPCVGMLAYGWVFHMGLFNFYLSLGLCLWALALVWRPSRIRVAVAAGLFVLAYMAHALPLVWAHALIVYVFVARRLAPRHRVYLTAGSVLGIAVFRQVLAYRFETHWSPHQALSMGGIDQVWVFDGKYYLVLIGLLLVWGALFLQVLHRRGVRRTVLGVPFQLCVIGAAAVFLLPGAVLLPGFNHALAYITERMSLGVAVCVCAMLAAGRPRRLETAVIGVVTLTFFGFLYKDERALNSFEDRMQGVVAQLPYGDRVVSAITAPESRIKALPHMIDRVCLGRCFSYANYEPSTGQFRIRATRPNPYVTHRYQDSWDLQNGAYVPKESDLPLYQVDSDRGGRLFLRRLHPGSMCGETRIRLFSNASWRIGAG